MEFFLSKRNRSTNENKKRTVIILTIRKNIQIVYPKEQLAKELLRYNRKDLLIF